MNERLRELAEQAQQYAEWTTPQGLEWFDAFKEKFAELIVRECAEVVQEGRWMVPPSQEQLARSIKQHFGVEK